MDSIEKANAMQEAIVESLGYQEAFENLCQALSVDEKIDNFKFIMRMFEISNPTE